MASRTAALHGLLSYVAASLKGPQWRVVGGNRLKATLNVAAEGIVFFSAAGPERFTVMIVVGARFPAIETIVRQAGRRAGVSNITIKTDAVFPTIFERLSRITALQDYVSISAKAEISAAIQSRGQVFLTDIATIEGAATYASAHPLAYGHHSQRVPVLLAKAGRADDARYYMDQATAPGSPNRDLYIRYRAALEPLLWG